MSEKVTSLREVDPEKSGGTTKQSLENNGVTSLLHPFRT